MNLKLDRRGKLRRGNFRRSLYPLGCDSDTTVCDPPAGSIGPDPVAGGPTRTHVQLVRLGESGRGYLGHSSTQFIHSGEAAICHSGYILIGNTT